MRRYRDLETRVTRQRLIIEGLLEKMPSPEDCKEYLLELSEVSGMEVVIEPHGDTNYPGGGVAMWIHWKTSGAHLYTYYSSPTDRSKPLQHPLFTLDTYTCKPFSVEGVVRFTKEYFNPIEIVWREIRL